jgi:hypothetical protein
MDPLSVTASVIAILGAAATIAKQLNLLRTTLSHASSSLCSLTNEISDLRVVLGACETAIGELYSNPDLSQRRSRVPLSDLDQILGRIRESLAELGAILTSCMPACSPDTSSKQSIRAAKLKWVREKSNAQRLQNHVRESKQDLLVLLESHSVYVSLLYIRSHPMSCAISDEPISSSSTAHQVKCN